MLTRARARIAVTVPKTWFAGGTSTAFQFKKAMEKFSSDTIISRACVSAVMIADSV